ncbi:MAG TPA: TMEM175 family protein [Bacteroidia bacterium]|nr:TMEM175 family protein [Bacteroidia bacterium]
MNKTRLEAFSDGVMAIIITIMVLEIKVPHGDNFEALKPLLPKIISYVLSFIYLGIYWNNHHHMLHTIKHVSGGMLWANLHLLFWLSLVPFVTAWMGENHFTMMPVALYGFIMLMSAIAYFILQTVIISNEGKGSVLAKAVGKDIKGKLSPVLYCIAIAASFFYPLFSGFLYFAVAIMWLIPDQRIEKKLNDEE